MGAILTLIPSLMVIITGLWSHDSRIFVVVWWLVGGVALVLGI